MSVLCLVFFVNLLAQFKESLIPGSPFFDRLNHPGLARRGVIPASPGKGMNPVVVDVTILEWAKAVIFCSGGLAVVH
jgi:hypothetical protein